MILILFFILKFASEFVSAICFYGVSAVFLRTGVFVSAVLCFVSAGTFGRNKFLSCFCGTGDFVSAVQCFCFCGHFGTFLFLRHSEVGKF